MAKLEIIQSYGVLELFFKRFVLCRKIVPGEPMFVTRFVEASNASTTAEDGDNTTGNWTNRYDMLTKKQAAALVMIKDLEAKFDKKFAE